MSNLVPFNFSTQARPHPDMVKLVGEHRLAGGTAAHPWTDPKPKKNPIEKARRGKKPSSTQSVRKIQEVREMSGGQANRLNKDGMSLAREFTSSVQTAGKKTKTRAKFKFGNRLNPSRWHGQGVY